MFEILRLQIGQILRGHMTWLVVIGLTLPVLLTLAAVGAGGLEELRNELEDEQASRRMATGVMPESARRLTWRGEERSFLEGAVVLKQEGVFFRERPISPEHVVIVNDGFLVVRDGELWIDSSKQGRSRAWRVRYLRRRSPSTAEFSPDDVSISMICTIYLFVLYPQVICLLLALFYGTSVLDHELGAKTLTYVFTRPLPRWKYVVGKYLGILSVLAVPASLSLLGSWALLGGELDFTTYAALLACTLLALVGYNAVFILFGFLIPRRAMIAALLYGVVFELLLSLAPALVNQITVTYYLRSLMVELLNLEIPAELTAMVGGAGLSGGLLGLAVITLVSLALASLLASKREYVIQDQA